MKSKTSSFIFLTLVIGLFLPPGSFTQVITGAGQTEKYAPLLKGKNIAVVANKASVVGNRNLIDTLLALGFKIKTVFSPEHGFRGFAEAGEEVESFTDPATGIRVTSLYGKNRKPSAGDLKGIDLLVFDIQDVGVRFYTYISTLTLVMEACAENRVPVVLLDRPNPNSFYIDGPVLEKEFSSFVGMHPVPVVYGMTIGEYATMVNGEKWLKSGIRCRLTVITLQNYTHGTRFLLPSWPSPNLVSMNAIYLYPSLCFFEGTMMSVGRGTLYPFEVFGHPSWLQCSFTFIPRSIPGMSLHPPYEGRECRGIDLRLITRDRQEYLGSIQLSWLIAAYSDLGSDPAFFNNYFEKLAGTAKLKEQIVKGISEEEIRESWQPEIEKFKEIRAKYLLYPE